MKKLVLFATTIALILSLAACGAAEKNNPASQGTETVTDNEAGNAEIEPGSPESMIPTVINDPVLTYQENTAALTANNGASIGTEVECPRHSEADGVVFEAGEGENPFMPLTKRLDEGDGVEPGENQAVYVSFCPSQKDFGFMLQADTAIGVTIGENSEPCVFVMDNNYMVPIDTDLRIEPGNWYGIFLAISDDGNFQGAIWKDDAPDDVAYFSIALGAFENAGVYKDKSWELSIGFKGQSTLNIARYCYYTFSGFVNETAVPEIS